MERNLMLIFGTVLLAALLGIVASTDPQKDEKRLKSDTPTKEDRSSQILEYINTQTQRRKYALRFQNAPKEENEALDDSPTNIEMAPADVAHDRDSTIENEIKDEKHRKKRVPKQRFNGHGPQVVEPMGIFDPNAFRQPPLPNRPPPPPPIPTQPPPPPTKLIPVPAVPTNHVVLTPKPIIHHHGTFSPLRNEVSVGPPPSRSRAPPGPKLPFEQPKATMHGQLKPPPLPLPPPVPALRFQDKRRPLMFPTVRPPPPPKGPPKLVSPTSVPMNAIVGTSIGVVDPEFAPSTPILHPFTERPLVNPPPPPPDVLGPQFPVTTLRPSPFPSVVTKEPVIPIHSTTPVFNPHETDLAHIIHTTKEPEVIYGHKLKPHPLEYHPPKHHPKPHYEEYHKPKYTPKPHYEKPKPHYEPKKPHYETPKPHYEVSPKPHYEVHHAAKPHYKTPKPHYEVHSSPKPHYETPKKPHYEVHSSPKPHYETPKPHYSPKPHYETPKPHYEVHHSPEPHYETPKPHYEVHHTPKPHYEVQHSPSKPHYDVIHSSPKPHYTPEPYMPTTPEPYHHPPKHEKPKPYIPKFHSAYGYPSKKPLVHHHHEDPIHNEIHEPHPPPFRPDFQPIFEDHSHPALSVHPTAHPIHSTVHPVHSTVHPAIHQHHSHLHSTPPPLPQDIHTLPSLGHHPVHHPTPRPVPLVTTSIAPIVHPVHQLIDAPLSDPVHEPFIPQVFPATPEPIVPPPPSHPDPPKHHPVHPVHLPSTPHHGHPVHHAPPPVHHAPPPIHHDPHPIHHPKPIPHDPSLLHHPELTKATQEAVASLLGDAKRPAVNKSYVHQKKAGDGTPRTVEYGYSIGIHHGDGYSYQTRSGFDIYNSIFAHHHPKS